MNTENELRSGDAFDVVEPVGMVALGIAAPAGLVESGIVVVAPVRLVEFAVESTDSKLDRMLSMVPEHSEFEASVTGFVDKFVD